VHEYLAAELRERLRQVFPEVRVRGLFGTPTLYETEIRRVDAARQRIRRKQEAARRTEGREAEARARAARRAGGARIRPSRPLPFRVARRLLPASVRGWLRSMVASRPGVGPRSSATATAPAPAPAVVPPPAVERPPEMTMDQFLEFSVADLFYADTDLDRAMDLLAICRIGDDAGPA
ncbi:MAG TPA: hypothetical protein VIU37_14045, partial [Candidatus Limnocylindrales bacterium]